MRTTLAVLSFLLASNAWADLRSEVSQLSSKIANHSLESRLELDQLFSDLIAKAREAGNETLLRKLERLQVEAADWPSAHPFDPDLPIQHLRVAMDATADCENAIDISPGRSLHVGLSPSELWFRVVAPAPGSYAISSLGSTGDTELEVWRSCALRPGELFDRNDDFLGLQAVAAVAATRAGEHFYVRVKTDPGSAVHLNLVGGTYQISGRVTMDGVSTSQIYVGVRGETGAQSTTSIAADGSYQLTTYGDVRVRTGTYGGGFPISKHLMEAYPDVPCVSAGPTDIAGCNDPASMAVFTPLGAPYAGIDFHLVEGGRIVGTLVSERSGLPLAYAGVLSHQVGSGLTKYVETDTLGRYEIPGLPASAYVIEAQRAGYISQLHFQTNCDPSPCDPSLGTPVPVALGEGKRVDFALESSRRLIVTLTGLTPHRDVDVRVTAVDGTGGILARGRAGADGVANVEIDRAPGPFRFWANSYYVISQVYPSHLCDDLNCTDEVLLGGILNMPEEGLLQLTMPMSSRAPVRGRIVEAVTGNGVEYARVSFRRVGTAPTSTYDIVTDEQGYYDFANVVHPGQYFVHAGSGEHVDELYPEIVCQGPFQLWNCGEGTAITIPLGGLEGLDFELNRSATITGSLTESGQPYVGTSLTFALLDNDLISEGGGNSFSSTYELDDIIPGTYRLGLRSGYSTTPIYPMLYDAIYCDRPDDEQYPFENCPVGAGEVITLVSGEERTGVDFEIKSFNGRMVEVTRSDTGAPLAAIALDLWST